MYVWSVRGSYTPPATGRRSDLDATVLAAVVTVKSPDAADASGASATTTAIAVRRCADLRMERPSWSVETQAAGTHRGTCDGPDEPPNRPSSCGPGVGLGTVQSTRRRGV